MPPARGGGGDPHPRPPASLPAARCPPGSRRRLVLPALPAPPARDKNQGRGRCGKTPACPFLKASRASRDAAVGQGDGTPEEVPREAVWVFGPAQGLAQWLRAASQGGCPAQRDWIVRPGVAASLPGTDPSPPPKQSKRKQDSPKSGGSGSQE
ncbi:uncharacterized protein [Agelaius tricolor]|uniref:uncharacterized protein n=1 Tax=Agelaius tricolor TaxID=9191 RepID=UPI0039F20DC3